MFGHFPIRRLFYGLSVASIAVTEALHYSVWPEARWLYAAIIPVMALGIYDVRQKKHAILRNFPILGHGRYLLEMIRPEINQYFVESDLDGRPFDRERRSNIYQRAKKELNTVPFGTKKDVYEVGYEWMNHSIRPACMLHDEPRVAFGSDECRQPYSASIFNVSAMSYGALSKNAIMALNKGAQASGFAHNTGEGGLSPYHLQHGGDLIWQIGTGYFSCRDKTGCFNPELFAQNAAKPSVKMIEIKLSQGAKPGHGGILPAAKITPEIAQIRNVEMGKDVLSPPAHTAFSTPIELLVFLHELRELSKGKPVGFKLCVGHPHEVLALCKAMVKTGILPDFITVDGGEGGTGAAPLEFSDNVGMPLNNGLSWMHNSLVGFGLRDRLRLIASGKVTTGFHLATKLALGADTCNSARGMMFALGCIQALQCHANTCPTGVATQNPDLVKGLVVEHKWRRVANFHDATVHSFLELLAAAGLEHPSQLKPQHIYRRASQYKTITLEDIYPSIEPNCLLKQKDVPNAYVEAWHLASAEQFAPASV